jgi:hypothetical protein
LVTPELRTAVENAYDVFASPRPSHIDDCPHCQHNFSKLLDVGLRSLAGNDLSWYAGSVFYTCGAAADFRHFLPRLLELSLSTESTIDPQIVLSKLPLAKWDHWPAKEREAICSVVAAALAELAEDPDDRCLRVDDVLCAAYLAGIDLGPLFEIVAAKPAAICALYAPNLDEMGRVRANNAFAKEGYGDRLRQFFERPDARAAVEVWWGSFGA